ncbi:apoptosis regulator Bcl-2-like [Thunnus albacares]|uniref:apoptosis regulator Bcl-2-like n=1 Tax=Thunnus maccoyii TaxID=8240 RepID=UPI001C4D333E|nr:apoptosis regulator Bcl-2-like [Thunnus maccoyii]XP_044195218.1 apoptosis regulator Bcl-2-like [Thunnus albacares]|eukprot:superscaffoldBa00001561_g11092
MAVSYDSRDIVFDYLRYKLLRRGVAWQAPPLERPIGSQRRRHEAPLPWRSEQARAWYRGAEEEASLPVLYLAPPPRLRVALRSAGDELERHYRGDLTAHASALLMHRDGGSARRSLAAVREELFRDEVNWGRIVVLMELGGALSAEVANTEGAWQVDDIAGWMAESLDSPPLQGWIEDNGGWDAFVELYGESRPPVSFWSLRMVFGLAVLGAAGITLGALFTQK